MSERSLISALKRKYRQTDYCVLSQVRIPTGVPGRTRIVDGLVVGLRQARDSFIYGYEMKSSRADWQLELSNPQKAEDVAQYCDTWSVVADRDIIRIQDVPKKWGFYELYHGGLEEEKAPESLSPAEPTRAFWSAILGAISEQLSPKVAQELLQDQYDKGFSEGRKTAKDGVDNAFRVLEDRIVTLREHVAEMQVFLDKIGIRGAMNDDRLTIIKKTGQVMALLRSRTYKEPFETVLAAVTFILDGGMSSFSTDLATMRDLAQNVLRAIDVAAAVVPAPEPPLDARVVIPTMDEAQKE